MKQHGCPLNNLAQEMSTLDEGFRQRIEDSFTLWIDALAEVLEEAKTKNYISKNTDCQSVARFDWLVNGYWCWIHIYLKQYCKY